MIYFFSENQCSYNSAGGFLGDEDEEEEFFAQNVPKSTQSSSVDYVHDDTGDGDDDGKGKLDEDDE